MAEQITLKVLWSENLLGLSLDQTLKNEWKIFFKTVNTIFFLPRTRAWDQLNDALTASTWIGKEEKVATLNLASTVINNWQNDQTELNKKMVEKKFQTLFLLRLIARLIAQGIEHQIPVLGVEGSNPS